VGECERCEAIGILVRYIAASLPLRCAIVIKNALAQPSLLSLGVISSSSSSFFLLPSLTLPLLDISLELHVILQYYFSAIRLTERNFPHPVHPAFFSLQYLAVLKASASRHREVIQNGRLLRATSPSQPNALHFSLGNYPLPYAAYILGCIPRKPCFAPRIDPYVSIATREINARASA
jgi:hypothetical protein